MKLRIFLFILMLFLLILPFWASGNDIENIYPLPLSVVSTEVTLKWSGPPGLYYIYIGSSKNKLNLVGSSTSQEFKVFLSPDELCYWTVVRSYNNLYEYGPISSFVTNPLPIDLLYPPNDSSVATSLTLKWSGQGSTFTVKLGKSPDSLNLKIYTASNNVNVRSLQPDTVYFWQVASIGKYASATSKIDDFYTMPASPNLIYPQTNSEISTSVNLKWAGEGEEFIIKAGLSKDKLSEIGTTKNNTFYLSDLDPNTRYFWQIETVGKKSTSLSEIGSFVTAPLPVRLNYPLFGARGVATSVIFKWSSQAGETYDFYLGKSLNGLKLIAQNLPVSSFNRRLDYFSTYYWYVKAKGCTGFSTDSRIFNFKTVPPANMIYVTNFGSNTVSAIDGDTNKIISVIQTGLDPVGISINKESNKLYVTNFGSNNVSVINGNTQENVATISVGSSPVGICVNSKTGIVYVTNAWDGTVSVVNGNDNRVITTIPVGSWPQGIDVDPETNIVYVANWNSNSVSVIDGNTNQVISTIPVGTNPYDICVDPQTDMIYVSNNGDGTVDVINGKTNQVVSKISVGKWPNFVAVNQNTDMIYVANRGDNSVSVIEGKTNQVVSTIPVGKSPTGISIDIVDNMIYVTNSGDNGVSVIDGKIGKVVSVINVGMDPTGITSEQ